MAQGSHLSAALPTTRCHYYDEIVELRILYYYESTTIPCQLLPNVHTRTFRQNTCLHAAQLNTSHPPPIPGILYTTTWRRTPVVAAATNIVEAAHVPPEVSGATLVVLAGGAEVVVDDEYQQVAAPAPRSSPPKNINNKNIPRTPKTFSFSKVPKEKLKNFTQLNKSKLNL